MKPLPTQPYEYAEWMKAKVNRGFDVVTKLNEIAEEDKTVALELELCWAFALRVRESLMLRPAAAHEGAFLLVREGTKGGRSRVRALLGSADHSAEEVENRLRIVQATKRTVSSQNFEAVATATLSRRKLKIRHFSRQTGEESERLVSPQLLTYYRENWYMDAWCHMRNDLRRFAIDALRRVELTDDIAHEVPRGQLQDALEGGYGIFSGTNITWAKLRFTPQRTRWVAAEQWHPQQKGSYDQAGYYILEIPYCDDRELMMDILKHGAEVAVISPDALRERVRAEIQNMAGCYAHEP